MSGKLDQSLDQIMTDGKAVRGSRKAGAPRPRRNAAAKAKAAISVPTGGVQKNTKAAKTAKAPAATAVKLPPAKESKIIVSNLPDDVSEVMIKDFFNKSVGSVKKVLLTYGPNGRSRGVATVIFGKAESAAKAARELNGLEVDRSPMKIELVLGAQYAPEAAAPKSLAERANMPKNAAKEKAKMTAVKTNGQAGKAAAKKDTRKKKAGREGRPKKKTADELDAEMMDYFGGEAAPAAATNGAANSTSNGNTGAVVDEVM